MNVQLTLLASGFLTFITLFKFLNLRNLAIYTLSLYSLLIYSTNSSTGVFYLAFTITICAIANNLNNSKIYSAAIAIISIILVINKFLSGNQSLTSQIGVSFFTLQAISFLVDRKRENLEKVAFNELLLYLSFYPQLIAGPIIKGRDFFKSLNIEFKLKESELIQFFHLLSTGLFFKLFIADNLALYTNNSIRNFHSFDSFLDWTIIAIIYSFQLFFDFSGYSRMARAFLYLIGIKDTVNFNSPYLSKSYKEFWGRWHISLSSWLKEYIYVPLGGKNRFIMATFITFVISSLWHGASFNYLLWGLLHITFLLVEKFITNKNTIVKHALFLILLPYSWLVFRIENFSRLTFIFNKMSSFNLSLSSTHQAYLNGNVITAILLSILVHLYWAFNKKRKVHPVYLMGILVAFTLFFRGEYNSFIYLKF